MSGRKLFELMSPREPKLGEAVQTEHQRSWRVTGFNVMNANVLVFNLQTGSKKQGTLKSILCVCNDSNK